MEKSITNNLKLLEKHHIEKDYYYFDFEKPAEFKFLEGQFGIFGFPERDIEGRKFRAFSIASTNEENFVRIATKIIEIPSDFKKNLLSMNKGDSIDYNGPKGIFTFDDAKKAVFIAGGIGITPIRSMLLSKIRNVKQRNDILIYSELDSAYPFKEELEKLSNLKIYYSADVEPTQNIIKSVVKESDESVLFYLSGSPGFIAGIQGLLEQFGINKNNIKHDIFTGY